MTNILLFAIACITFAALSAGLGLGFVAILSVLTTNILLAAIAIILLFGFIGIIGVLCEIRDDCAESNPHSLSPPLSAQARTPPGGGNPAGLRPALACPAAAGEGTKEGASYVEKLKDEIVDDEDLDALPQPSTTEGEATVNDADEIDILMEKLLAAWGYVFINCDGKTCIVSPDIRYRTVEAPTLLEALRLAAALVAEGPFGAGYGSGKGKPPS